MVIVDEVRVSGDTLAIAEQFFRLAFPDAAAIHSAHWMVPKITTSPGGVRMNSALPIWYSDQTPHGRGVGDRDVTANQRSQHARIRRGNRFFSSRPDPNDERSGQLRDEITQIRFVGTSS